MSTNALQLAFNRFPWILHVFFLGSFAFVGAQTANLFVAQSIQPAIKTSATAPSSQRKVVPIELTAEAFAKMMGMKLPETTEPDADTPDAADPNKEPDMSSEPVRTSLKLQLIATVVANRPEWSIATIRDLGLSQDDVYMVGDTILGAKIIDIQQVETPDDIKTDAAAPDMHVLIVNSGHREFIDVTAPGGGAGPVMPKPMASNDAPSLNGEGIKKLDDHHFQIERSTVNATLSNLNTLATQAVIVPSFKNGQSNGFKLTSIHPDSLYTKIGIQNGDVIEKINGLEMNSPDKALEAYGKLKSASALDMTVERNGQSQSFHYAIQ